MTFEDSNRIIPLFYLFSSLFSHSLISVHDSEFFGHEMEGETVEQFSQSELLFGNISMHIPGRLAMSRSFGGLGKS